MAGAVPDAGRWSSTLPPAPSRNWPPSSSTRSRPTTSRQIARAFSRSVTAMCTGPSVVLVVFALQAFAPIEFLTQGGPNGSTETLVFKINRLNRPDNIGIGAADLCDAADADKGDLADQSVVRQAHMAAAIDKIRDKFGGRIVFMVLMVWPQTVWAMEDLNKLILWPATFIQFWAGGRFYRAAWRAGRHGGALRARADAHGRAVRAFGRTQSLRLSRRQPGQPAQLQGRLQGRRRRHLAAELPQREQLKAHRPARHSVCPRLSDTRSSRVRSLVSGNRTVVRQ